MKIDQLNWKEQVMVYVLLAIGFAYVTVQKRFIPQDFTRFVAFMCVTVMLALIFIIFSKRKNTADLGFFLGTYWMLLSAVIIVINDWMIRWNVSYSQGILLAIVFVSPSIAALIYKIFTMLFKR
jgi:hypothetical protein